jgi:hypothetical protein
MRSTQTDTSAAEEDSKPYVQAGLVTPLSRSSKLTAVYDESYRMDTTSHPALKILIDFD